MATGEISDTTVEYLNSHNVSAVLEEALHDVLLHLPSDPLSFLQDAFLKKTPLRLIVVGSLFSGKTTQCSRLAQKYGIRHIQPEALLFKESKVDNEMGRVIHACIDARKPVPEDVVAAIVLRAISDAEKSGQGWVLDAYPRNRLETVFLQTNKVSPQKLFYLDVESSTRESRMLGRGVDAGSSRNAAPPDFPTYDLITGIPLGRTPNIIATHVQFTEARRKEILLCYKPFYVAIDANQSADDVHAEVCHHIRSLDVAV